MWKLRSVFGLWCFVLLCSSAALVGGQQSRKRDGKWLTLSGAEPFVIARGGFSGVFPDSSLDAYLLAVTMGSRSSLAWCDVQLTKDGYGICSPDILLQNVSDIDNIYPNKRRTYDVNGVLLTGWFSVDFTLQDLQNASLKQRFFSRAPNFDANQSPILTVEDVFYNAKPPGLWLSIPHNAFFSQHNLSMRSFFLSVSRNVIVNYISSPEVGFLRSIASRKGRTKLVFQFLERDAVEPTTNQTFDSLLNNLTLIKTFADGIIVPKNYIWPVDNSQYLLNYTSLVLDAHAAGLEVFASGFANDGPMPYDYNFDPVSEYLSFVDNGQFSVDGVLSDFPVTPSATVACYAHGGRNDTIQADILIISNEGASGEYPGCTDIAYRKAVSDGADVIDCIVQITNDGIPFCLGSINLRDRTTVTQSDFSNRSTNNRELNIVDGIFAYNLTWTEIQTLKPAMYSPYAVDFSLFRNPKARTDGKFMQLSDFLAFANNQSSLSGVLITIENAAYLAENQGLGVTDAVLSALKETGQNQTTKKIMIRSSDSSVLKEFESNGNYELVYLIDEDVRDILNSTILEIRDFASSVVVSKRSIFPTDAAFVTGETNIVSKLHAFNLTVFVQFFLNEYPSQPWDFFTDPYVEINTYVSAKEINGVITGFPATAERYRRNLCLASNDTSVYMSPVQPRGLIGLMMPQSYPPAEAPNPILIDGNVTEPPLPPVVARPPPGNTPTAPGPTPPPSGQPTHVASTFLSGIAILLLSVFVLC